MTGDSKRRAGFALTRVFSGDDGNFEATVEPLIENGTEHNNDKARTRTVGYEDGPRSRIVYDLFDRGLKGEVESSGATVSFEYSHEAGTAVVVEVRELDTKVVFE